MKQTYVQFRQDRYESHPVTRKMIHRIEITDTPAQPGSMDSSMARFTTDEAFMVIDAIGVHLKLGDDVFIYPSENIAEAKNIPLRKGKE